MDTREDDSMSADGKEGYASLRAARIINDMPGGKAFWAILIAHGFNHLEAKDLQTGTCLECCSLERMMEERP